MGKRELGQLSIIDLIVSLLIAELATISIENYKGSILYSLIPIVILTLLQCILAYFSLKKPKFRIFLDGNPSVIIKNGKINYNEMLKQRYNLDDLLVQLRDKGYRSIEEVEYAILESSGTLSIFPYENGKSPLPLPIILDGDIQEDTIKHLKRDKKWVYNFLDKKNINIVKNKYNIKKLLNEIYLREKKKINNIRFDFNIGELPEYLYGDSIRLKQVLICILDNLIENTKEGFIEVNVNSINKYDVCRLIITIENSGIPLSLEEINNILDNEKEIDENISLEDINKLINMMNGSLNIKSEEGNEFTISIDSIIVEPKKEEITNETDILFISNNERILKGLEYAFEEYTTNSVMSGIDAIDLIKSGENYNLIIIDDEIKPISGLETLKRLRKENINIPAIIMLDEGKEHIKNHYIKDGFTDYILKNDIKNEINRIIKKML